jgi:hypothetical protein
MQHSVFTIGHSTQSQERFVELLNHHQIKALCDVRSKPYSRNNPQFNREVPKEGWGQPELPTYFLVTSSVPAAMILPATKRQGPI